MKIDAYVKVVLTVIAVALVALAAHPWIDNNLLMEAPDGTLRSVDLEAKSEATRLKVQAKFQ